MGVWAGLPPIAPQWAYRASAVPSRGQGRGTEAHHGELGWVESEDRGNAVDAAGIRANDRGGDGGEVVAEEAGGVVRGAARGAVDGGVTGVRPSCARGEATQGGDEGVEHMAPVFSVT